MKHIVNSFTFFALLLPVPASAYVVINEVAWMGSPESWVESSQPWRYEWVEVWNTGDRTMNLEGWQLEGYRQEQDFDFAMQGIVEPGGYFVIGASSEIPEVDFNFDNLGGKLVNGGQRLVLKDAQGDVVEELDATEGWFAGDNDSKYSMERRFADRPAGELENWGTSLELGGTPGKQNTIFGKEAIKDVGAVAVQQGVFPRSNTGLDFRLSSVFSLTFGLALLLALLSAGGILFLRRRLALKEPE